MIRAETRCAVCGKICTVQRKRDADDADFPILHKAFRVGYTCKGTFVPGRDVNETAASIAFASIKKNLGI